MAAESSRRAPFRVIVVGGGVGGLVASHVLQKADIDHVVLERRSEPAPPEGASIAIYPHGCRILEQIGVLDAARGICVPMDKAVMRAPDGSQISSVGFFDHVKANHGYDLLLFERREFLQMLFDRLPDQSKVHFNKRVVGIRESAAGVEAHLQDGSCEAADIVIGCDGVHSFVREVMWSQANERMPGVISAAEKRSMTVPWTCLIGVAPQMPGLGLRDMTVVHGTGHSFLILSQPQKIFFFVFFKVRKPMHWPNWPRWTADDAEAAARRVSDLPISESVLFGELWKRRFRGQLISVEEGVLQHWHWGRTVLAGDAVHKVTPNIALGGNLAMESIAVLSNLLVEAVREAPDGRPGLKVIEAVFGEYQRQRLARAREVCDVSRFVTRLQAWDSRALRFAACYLGLFQREDALAQQLAPIIKRGPKLDFVPLTQQADHVVGWMDEDGGRKPRPVNRRFSTLRKLLLPVVGLSVALSPVLLMMAVNAKGAAVLAKEG